MALMVSDLAWYYHKLTSEIMFTIMNTNDQMSRTKINIMADSAFVVAKDDSYHSSCDNITL